MNIAIIQARCGSSRFPNKVLQELWNGKSVLEILVERLRLSKELDMIVVGTTTEPEDLQIKELCDKIGIDCYNVGNRDSAMDTVYKTIQEIKKIIDDKYFNVIDITADCCLIDPFQIDIIINQYKKYNYNYISNCMIRSFPIGFDIQIYENYYFERINEIIKNKNHRVHTGWNIWTHSVQLNSYLQDNLEFPENLFFGNVCAEDQYFKPDWRIVLDYPEDLILLKNIINHFNRIDFTYQEIIDYLIDNPKLLKINENCTQKVAGKDK